MSGRLLLRRRPGRTGGDGDEGPAGEVPPPTVDLPPIADGTAQATSALAAKAATAGLMACLVLGPVGAAAGLAALGAGSRPSAAVPVRVADASNARAVVGEFAQEVVVTWLTATQDKPDGLLALVKDAQVAGLSSQPFSVAGPAVAGIVPAGPGGWSVTVAVTVTDVRQQTARRFFQVPVQLAGGTLTALALPTPLAPPPVAGGSTGQYRTQVDVTSALGQTVTQFLAAYLTGSGEVSRYLTPGVNLPAISPAPYGSVRLNDLRSLSDLDPAAAVRDRQTVRVLAVATGQVSDQQSATVSYPLTLTGRAGRWEVTAIDPAPATSPPPAAGLTVPAGGATTAPTTPGVSPPAAATP